MINSWLVEITPRYWLHGSVLSWKEISNGIVQIVFLNLIFSTLFVNKSISNINIKFADLIKL
jgi:hypothetical protein